MAEILKLDFNQLPRATRERLVAITQRKAGPAPIFERRNTATAGIVGWSFLLLIFGLGSFGLFVGNFGSAYNATQPGVAAAAYALCLFFCVLSVLGMIRGSKRKKAHPYVPGAYVFAADTVVLDESSVKLLSGREISKLEPVHHYRNGSYTHTQVTLVYSDGSRQPFSFFGKPKAEAALDRLRSEGMQAADAMARRDANLLYPIDPMFEARMLNFQASADPSGPVTTPLPGWTRKIALISLGVACVLGPIGYGLRNLASDEIAFNEAETSYAYRAYLDSGWRHLNETKTDYLPRAQLKEAAEKTDPDERLKAIEEVAKGDLIPTVRAKANDAAKAALHAVFEKASAQNTVAALRDFEQQHPQAEDVPAAKVRIHELFAKTLADFKPRASKPTSIPFVEALLAYMEKNDSPPVEVRFRRHNAPTLLAADKILSKADPSDKPGSELASASSHFDAEHAASREGALISAMQKGFSSVFPADVLPLIKGADLDPNDLSTPGTNKPSIFVDYTAGWSGSTYSDPTNGRRFVGIVFAFDVLMTIPDNGKLLNLKFKVQPPDTFSVSYESFANPDIGAALKTSGDGPSDSQVYEVMALRAFDQLSTKIQEELFRPEAAQATAAK